MNKLELRMFINWFIGDKGTVYLPSPFVPTNAGSQEEVVGIFKDENNQIHVLTWNFDNGGNREEYGFNAKYDLEFFTKSDLQEIYNQLKFL
jgi:hypothetical protein